ncbi:UDP-GalNAc:beta-1,3-N-acetylgalactosaminyltransferase 2, partial [Choanephora cucurbitarum]
MVQPTTLPFFRQKHTPPSLNVPRRYELSVKLVCLLSTVPALWHAIQNIKHIYSITPSISLQTSWTEYTVATLWCVLSAYWHWHLTTHLMQQWCYRLEIKQAFMRCLGFIGSMTLLSVTISLWCQDPIVTQLMICSVLLIISLPSFSTFLLWPLLTVMVISAILLSGKIQYDPYRLMELMPDQYALDQYPPTSSTAIVLILSSWSMEAAERRQLIRSQLPKDMQYRFVLGQPSQPKMAWMQPLLTTESDQFHDLLIVPAPDTHSSQKLLEAMRWTKSIEYEYLIKTEDDMFVRWDRVLDELQDDWRGFVYHNMPSDQDLPLLPDYTWGKFYWLSRKVVELLIYTDHPHRWTEKDDINLSLWLFGFNIKPVHDRRIQTADVCEDDLIAKQVALTDFKQTWTQMVEHVQTHQPICQGLALTRCALCYPCHGRSDDWRSQSVDCDPFRGVSPASLPYPKIPQVAEVKDQLSNGTDHWIIPNMLSTETSVYSNETHWHLLYWVCWTSEPSTFTDRHWRALELVWIHEPQAVIFMISNTLSQSFFQDYLDQGYQIQVVQFDKQRLLNWGWYFGSGTQDWLSGWEQWEKGKFFYWHLTDYIRCLLLYHYGGTYMDMDALWIRIPPDSQMEFIGSDYSQVHSDRAWTL